MTTPPIDILQPAGQPQHQRLRVVLADDHVLSRATLVRVLSAHPSIEVVGAGSDGVEVERLAHELVPDVVVLDVQMPRRDGFEAARAILANRPVRIVFVTSFTESAYVDAARAMGAELVDKAAGDSELLAAVLGCG